MKQRFINHIQSIQDPALRKTCETILTIDKFFTWPASLSFHHAYEGGLLAHTVEVCDYALGICRPLVPVNVDILIAAALWHDFMRMEEYRFFWDWPDNTVGQRLLAVPGTDESGLQKFFGHTDYGKRIHHIAGSTAEFTIAAREHGVGKAMIEEVQHCILAHHGRKDWGSPVEPQTLEALILHQADMLSAKFGATK